MNLMDLTLGETHPSEAVNSPEPAPWESTQEDKDLEIYRKAKRFESLNLLSGNTVSGDLLDFISKRYGDLGVKRYKLAQYILTKLNYKPSPDVLLMLSCTKKARIVVATAGAGKTTSLQFDLLISKFLDKALGTDVLKPELIEGTAVHVPKILYLNYNTHNVKPIEDRHSALCKAVNTLFESSQEVDDSIDSSTVHAFCHRWLKAFSKEIEIPELKVIDDDTKAKVWSSIITPRWKKYYGEEDVGVEWETLDELYNYQTESMLDWDSFFLTAKFVDTDLKEEFVKACLKKYDSMKKAMGLLDFTDYLKLMIDALREHPHLKRRLQERYRVIIADENQDFTKLMNALLLELYDSSINSLIVVGDPDQTIYAFKGVSPDNVVSLAEQLDDVELLGLDTNYRCPDKIVEAAKAILNLNVLRFEKPINTVRTGGQIFQHPIQHTDEQVLGVLKILEGMSKEELSKTVLTFRNNKSATVLAEELFYRGVPYNMLDSRLPFSNLVFRHITNALRALRDKDDVDLNKTLCNFMPLTKDMWSRILEENKKLRRNHLHDLLFPNNLPRGTAEAYNILVRVSDMIDTNPVSDYIMYLIKLYRTYHFDYIVKVPMGLHGEEDMLVTYLERTLKFYSRPMMFDHMMQELRNKNNSNPVGVTFSTFHGLKGLEFDTVIAVDFNESIFPNFASIEMKYTENTAMEEKESENRLCYVLVTRAIKELHLFYKENDPSVYVSLICKANEFLKEEKSEINLGSISNMDLLNAQQNFISKLIGDRG